MADRSPRLIALGVAALIAGCGTHPPSRQETARNLHSWAATARMSLEAWAAGSLPSRFAEQVLARSAEGLTEQEQSADRADQSGELARRARELREAVSAARRAVLTSDREGGRAQARRLAAGSGTSR